MTVNGIFLTTDMVIEYMAIGVPIIAILFLFYLTRSK